MTYCISANNTINNKSEILVYGFHKSLPQPLRRAGVELAQFVSCGGGYQHQGSGRKGVNKSGNRKKWVKKIRNRELGSQCGIREMGFAKRIKKGFKMVIK